MKQSFLTDERGKPSSKRISGLIIMVYVLLLNYMDGYEWYSSNSEIMIALIVVAASMLSLDSVTDIFKRHGINTKNNGATTNTQDEPD